MTAAFGEVVLASSNRAKLGEMARLLAGSVGRLAAQDELGIAPADEPHMTFVENALAKARHASAAAGRPALADDSGLCVDALGGAPGVHSARFAGPAASDEDNNLLLLERMRGSPGRSARFHCAVALCRTAADPCPLIAEGSLEGRIAAAGRGSGGFGYDSLFELPDGRTVAELEPAAKDALSHRGIALRELARRLAGAAS